MFRRGVRRRLRVPVFLLGGTEGEKKRNESGGDAEIEKGRGEEGRAEKDRAEEGCGEKGFCEKG